MSVNNNKKNLEKLLSAADKKVHCGTQQYRSLSRVLKLDLAATWSVAKNPLGLSDIWVYRRYKRVSKCFQRMEATVLRLMGKLYINIIATKLFLQPLFHYLKNLHPAALKLARPRQNKQLRHAALAQVPLKCPVSRWVVPLLGSFHPNLRTSATFRSKVPN